MDPSSRMIHALRVLVVVAMLVVSCSAAQAQGVTLFRLFLLDGTIFVSYGEFVRLDDNVIFSMPVGGPADQPRLQVATVPTKLIDWVKTSAPFWIATSLSSRCGRQFQTRSCTFQTVEPSDWRSARS